MKVLIYLSINRSILLRKEKTNNHFAPVFASSVSSVIVWSLDWNDSNNPLGMSDSAWINKVHTTTRNIVYRRVVFYTGLSKYLKKCYDYAKKNMARHVIQPLGS